MIAREESDNIEEITQQALFLKKDINFFWLSLKKSNGKKTKKN